ncbi:hypothetical protein HPHPP28B_1329 [Helicobacter pylori Hp P-28b]|nr:hypothetical protein HPHPP28B_1329 [Helicobacter pylori Hp P-28b]
MCKKDNRNKHYASGLKTLKNLIGLKRFFVFSLKFHKLSLEGFNLNLS